MVSYVISDRICCLDAWVFVSFDLVKALGPHLKFLLAAKQRQDEDASPNQTKVGFLVEGLKAKNPLKDSDYMLFWVGTPK